MLTIVFVGSTILGQFGHTEERVDLFQRAGREALFQVPMHLRHLGQFRGIENEAEVRLAANPGISRDAGMRRRGMGRAERLDCRKRFGRLAGGQLGPAYAVDVVKQMHHVDALIEFNWGKSHALRRSIHLQCLIEE